MKQHIKKSDRNQMVLKYNMEIIKKEIEKFAAINDADWQFFKEKLKRKTYDKKSIKASLENINYISGELDGKGLTYLWFRVPLQFLFIIWTYLSTRR